jgi:hypothetical protein
MNQCVPWSTYLSSIDAQVSFEVVFANRDWIGCGKRLLREDDVGGGGTEEKIQPTQDIYGLEVTESPLG